MASAKKSTGKAAAKKKPAAKKTASKKPSAKKSTAKKTRSTAKKAETKKVKSAAKKVKSAAKKTKATAKKEKGAAAKKIKAAAKKTKAAAKTVKAVAKTAKAAAKKKTKVATKTRKKAVNVDGSPELFAPLCEGERADALRILLEDARLASMAKVGRYRVIAVEPLVLKPSHPLGDHRIARVVLYDYSADRCVEANLDLDHSKVETLSLSKSQPMLAAEEEQAAMHIAVTDERVRSALALGEVPQAAMHYWSQRPSELSHNRRTATVLFGEPGARPSFVAVVDLLDAQVTEVVPATLW